VGIASSEDEIGAAFVQAAAGAIANIFADLCECGGFVQDRKTVAGLRRGMPRFYV
jgi:hypothetical protein